jgi:hypothetical protein
MFHDVDVGRNLILYFSFGVVLRFRQMCGTGQKRKTVDGGTGNTSVALERQTLTSVVSNESTYPERELIRGSGTLGTWP